MGKLKSVIDELSRTTTYSYDHWKRLSQVAQPGSATTSYAYDNQGNLTTVTDAEGKATTYLYDDLGRLLSVTSPDTGLTKYTYDVAGNLGTRTDANGITISYTYDTLNRLTLISYPDVTRNITYTYDQGANGKGRLTGVADPSGTTSLQYDALGRLTLEDKIISGQSYTTAYSYDNSGLLSAITYPSGRTVSYIRDAAGRIMRIQSTSEGNTTTLADNIVHKPFGPLAGMDSGNGLNLSNSYDELYRLSSSQAGSVYNRIYTLLQFLPLSLRRTEQKTPDTTLLILMATNSDILLHSETEKEPVQLKCPGKPQAGDLMLHQICDVSAPEYNLPLV